MAQIVNQYNLLFPGSAGQQLFVYIQTIQSYLAPPITMVFGLGILWTGLTPAGALSGLVIGFLLGMAKFIAGVKETQPQTKSRHSHQAWIQNYSGQSDKVIASLQEK